MLYLAYLACIILICVNAEHIVRCNNETNPKSTNSVTLVPSPDHVGGRYVMEWCTKGDKNITKWELYIYYNTTKKPDQCRHYNFTYDKTFKPHSHVEENMNIDLNCSNNKRRTFRPPMDYVTVQWFMGPVPAARYEMKLSEQQGGAGEPWDVTENCTSAVHTVTCRLRVPPGAYTLVFELKEPWMYGSVAVDTASKDFNRTVTEAGAGVGVGAGSWGAAWWGAGGALALCVPGALLLHRARRSSSPRRKHAASEAEEVGAGVGAEGGEAAGGVRVLLLYARDCPLLVAAARRLAALLQHVARDGVGGGWRVGGEGGGARCEVVYDLYMPAVSAVAARAPGEWVREVMGREEVRVVLLQTPAAACLYAAQLTERGYTLALEQPLLGARAAVRRPHCADPLLQLALRLMCESAHAQHHPYRKYYIAEICGLEANVVPLVTPQRRYLLPAAAPLLLRDLAPPAPPPPPPPPALLQQFARAVEELQQYVRDNPDYLNEELIFL
ncbi:hypothetical protein RR46_02159 [Papilio xuthus]|uniref:SEFIR domain-containing protein n=1 Tax=Papilio xuthus TaxID=66420 RepID=A0A194QJ09_PAPXU|nr:hypothetical protein RR46_02159 [Papilio xuthus]